MFFRFYILIILGCLSVLLTPLWFGSLLILTWCISLPIRGVSRYKKWKAHHSIFNAKSLSFCIKSIKRQKQNFKILNVLLRKKILIQFFKKLSILLDDINVKFTSGCDSQGVDNNSTYKNPFIYSQAYDDCAENIYHIDN